MGRRADFAPASTARTTGPVKPLLLSPTVLALAAIALAFPSSARAQIYAWRDAAGNLVLSDQAKTPSAVTYEVTGASPSPYRTTRPLTGRAAPYQAIIEEHAALNAVSADLIRAVIQAESAFDPRALSIKGAMGLMQLMPDTAAELGVRDPFDPRDNIRGGVKYLKQLLDKYDGNVELALAAYNAGPTAVKRYGGTVPPYRETRNYVARVRSSAAAGAAAVRTRVYRTTEIVNGREVVLYTTSPRSGSEPVKAADRR